MKKFDEPSALNCVADFHRTFELPVVDSPSIPAKDRCVLRINLIEEELAELKVAIAQSDLTEVADAFADLQYVLSGAILEFGLGERFKDIFDEVQRSNMSKVCKSLEEAEATVKFYKNEKDVDGEIIEKDGQYLVYRKSDGKVLKSINYSEASLDRFVKDMIVK